MNKPEMYHTDLTADEVRALLRYDPESGVFTWIAGRADRIGKAARSPASHGYWTIHICGKNYRCARLAHLYMTGRWPEGEIDHIDGDRANDGWSNLRVATRRQNEWNKRGVANRSGFKGVTYLNRRSPKKWRALIRVDGKRRLLGFYERPEDAAAAYAEAARVHFGEFAKASQPLPSPPGGGT